jgi:hypothetical protein
VVIVLLCSATATAATAFSARAVIAPYDGCTH